MCAPEFEEYRTFLNAYIKNLLDQYNTLTGSVCSCKDISTSSMVEIDKDCGTFFKDNRERLKGIDASIEDIAQIFFLTRNHLNNNICHKYDICLPCETYPEQTLFQDEINCQLYIVH